MSRNLLISSHFSFSKITNGRFANDLINDKRQMLNATQEGVA